MIIQNSLVRAVAEKEAIWENLMKEIENELEEQNDLARYKIMFLCQFCMVYPFLPIEEVS